MSQQGSESHYRPWLTHQLVGSSCSVTIKSMLSVLCLAVYEKRPHCMQQWTPSS